MAKKRTLYFVIFKEGGPDPLSPLLEPPMLCEVNEDDLIPALGQVRCSAPARIHVNALFCTN